MQNINVTYWEVTEPDGGGMYDVALAKFSTKEAAEQYKKYLLDKSSYWPKNVRERSISAVVYDSFEELLEMRENAENIRKQIAELENKLKGL